MTDEEIYEKRRAERELRETQAAEKKRISAELERVFAGTNVSIEDIVYSTAPDAKWKMRVLLDLRYAAFTYDHMMQLPAVFGTERLNFENEDGFGFGGSDVTPPDTYSCFVIEVLK